MQSSIAVDAQTGLFFLFPTGKRPDARAVRDVVEANPQVSLSHDPARGDAPDDGERWLELLIDGMTFDLRGLGEGDPVAPARYEYRFDCPSDLLESRKEALRLEPGPHLASGAHTLPIVRGQMALASLLAGTMPGLDAIGWGPSGCLMGVSYFRSVIDAWVGGGPFPALALTAFRPTMDDALQSVGLAFFTGQEVRLEPALVSDRTAATRLGVRLVNLLVGTGRLEAPETITGPDGGPLRLEPSGNGRFVRVFPG